MSTELSVRCAGPRDIAEVDVLLARSYPVLLKPDYPPSVLVTALPLISRVQPTLVTCGTYYVVEEVHTGALVGAGGWTPGSPGRGRTSPALGHIRHVVCDHRQTRCGIGRMLMHRIFQSASDAGIAKLECLSTRTAVPFYAALGFVKDRAVDVPLRAGIVFPAISMHRTL
ncbi:GNAT family N-acetyltransferase [Meridianimarinicoccus aquatilis]|uniref:GNAT family N-acetyltransferase n=1 Tax=Meridianimarinicoccus aquatilis TaxID=2552766 RepID=A0A4R6ATU9_9RHOB|nr:GNAT family N-acetyltransferase [Fluviibacterium aquatile]TDL86964.1 GNAT family N-acetyltransferase [Fluviibacterium aquatile]